MKKQLLRVLFTSVFTLLVFVVGMPLVGTVHADITQYHLNGTSVNDATAISSYDSSTGTLQITGYDRLSATIGSIWRSI